MIPGLGFRVQGSGFRVQGLGKRAPGHPQYETRSYTAVFKSCHQPCKALKKHILKPCKAMFNRVKFYETHVADPTKKGAINATRHHSKARTNRHQTR